MVVWDTVKSANTFLESFLIIQMFGRGSRGLNYILRYRRPGNSYSFLRELFFSSSLQDQEPTKKPPEGKDFQDGQFHLSEYDRLLLEACQFAKYTSEHPLEKWTVCSLPNLYKSSVEKCQQRLWEFKTPSLS